MQLRVFYHSAAFVTAANILYEIHSVLYETCKYSNRKQNADHYRYAPFALSR